MALILWILYISFPNYYSPSQVSIKKRKKKPKKQNAPEALIQHTSLGKVCFMTTYFFSRLRNVVTSELPYSAMVRNSRHGTCWGQGPTAATGFFSLKRGNEVLGTK